MERKWVDEIVVGLKGAGEMASGLLEKLGGPTEPGSDVVEQGVDVVREGVNGLFNLIPGVGRRPLPEPDPQPDKTPEPDDKPKPDEVKDLPSDPGSSDREVSAP